MSIVPKAKLRVNKITVDMNPFVEEFVARTVVGMVTPLKGVENIKNVDVYMEKDTVKISVNGNDITLTEFPTEIIVNTVTALVSSLKDVDNIDNLDISITV